MKRAGTADKHGYHHGDLRRALVDAARTTVNAEGVGRVTMRGVAATAGVSAAAPYRHFADREALVAAVMAEGFDELAEAIERARASEVDPVAGMAASGQAYLDFAVANTHLYRLMFGSETQATDHDDVRAAARDSFDIVRRTTEALAGAGIVDADQTDELALMAWSAMHGIASLHLDGLFAVLSDRSYEAIAETMFAVVAKGLRAE